MPGKLPEQVNVVDAEIRDRMEKGMLAKNGRDIRGNDEEYFALLKLARMSGADPLVSTYLEVDAAVQKLYQDWHARMKAISAPRPQDQIRRIDPWGRNKL